MPNQIHDHTINTVMTIIDNINIIIIMTIMIMIMIITPTPSTSTHHHHNRELYSSALNFSEVVELVDSFVLLELSEVFDIGVY